MPVVIAATAETATGRMALVVTGLTSAAAILILRRDSDGVLPVRDTSEGTVIPVLQGATYGTTVYDYEPRQGDLTDYLVTSVDGLVLDDVTVTIPAWGTWLKSPGRPYLNTRCYFGAVSPVDRAGRRVLVAVEGAQNPVALTSRRTAPAGGLTLQTLTADQSSAVTALLDDGQTVMVDTAPGWMVPFRYVSVGGYSEARAYGGGELGLDRIVRTHELSGVAAVSSPEGVSEALGVKTYAQIGTDYGSYAALAADNATYAAIPT